MSARQTIRLFGVSEDTIRERLADVWSEDALSAVLSVNEEDAVLRLDAADEHSLETAVQAVTQRLGAFVYSEDDTALEALAVALLTEHNKTVAVAESCTGGLLCSRLTGVPGCSRVFGTGIVSYSWDCKKQLLGVSADTLDHYGAVSAETAREMADGVRRQAGADIGIAITGEAGPQAAEDKPVGTVFVALADAKRSWVKELHLDATAMDRAVVRRVAASYGLDLLRRYLQAYPTVMAGGERHTDYADRQRNADEPQARLQHLLPWRGKRKTRVIKSLAWLAVLALLIGGVLTVYNHILTPKTNRELQDDLANLYWSSTSDLTMGQPVTGNYPEGMTAQFRGLYDMNKDIAGWIRIPDTAINYPVTLYADGYYDNHNFGDQYSVYGQPYFYEGNTQVSLQTDTVLAIRGNNTRDEQMFSSLLSYRRIAYLREHSVIEMNTLYTAAKWEIFAVAVVNERDRASVFEYFMPNFANDEAFSSYVEQLCRRSLFRSDIEPTEKQPILLLTTDADREYGFSGARLVVAARKMTADEPTANYSVNYGMTWPAAYARRTTTRSTIQTTTTRSTTLTTTTVTTTTTTVSTTQTTTEPTSSTTTQSVAESTTSSASVAAQDTTTTLPSADDETEDTENNDDDYLGN